MIEINNVSVLFKDDGTEALSNISLHFENREFVCILGKSGAGKSTFVRTINGLQLPTSGSVLFHGVDITTYKEEDLRKLRREMGMIFQHFNLIPRLSVLQNVLTGSFGYRGNFKNLLGLFSEQEREEAERVIQDVELSAQSHRRVEQLSGGQKQRVAIARALLQKPSVFLGDEPVASLDPGTANRIFQLIMRIHQRHQLLTIINVHDVTLAQKYATRIIGLKEGKVVYDGSAAALTDEKLDYIYE
jgi:phosphonate transport system ATP-binding protein